MTSDRPWWGVVSSFRPLIMWAARPFAWAALTVIAARAALVLAIGWPFTTLCLLLAVASGARPSIPWAVFAAAVAAWEVAASRVVPKWRTWRRAMAVRRRWPVRWATVDAATADVQASFGGGTSSFLGSTRRLTRPVLGHPAFGPLPQIGDGWATFRCGPPFGTTMAALDKTRDALAGAYTWPHVDRVDLDYDNDSASWGRITFWFEPPPDDLADVDPDVIPDGLHLDIETL